MTDAAKKIDAGETMAEMWAGFSEAVIPFAGPGSTQHEEMRKAFYSGALCLFNWFMVQLDEDAEPTDADLDKVSAMDAEIRSFIEGAANIHKVRQ